MQVDDTQRIREMGSWRERGEGRWEIRERREAEMEIGDEGERRG